MSVTSRTHARANANVWARSTTWVANETVRALQEIVICRGLSMDYMHRNFDLFMASFRTWIAGRYLKSVVLEIYDTATDKLVERADFYFCYDKSSEEEEERFESTVENFKNALEGRKALPGTTRYRVVARRAPGAPELPGWEPTKLRDAGHLKKQDFGKIVDSSKIDVEMNFLG